MEAVSGAHLRLVLERQVDVVAGRELELQLRLQRALDMDMKLALGQVVDEGRKAHDHLRRAILS